MYKIIFYNGTNGYYLKDLKNNKIKLLFMVKRKNQKQYELLNTVLKALENVLNDDFDTIYNILLQFENEKEKKG